MIDLNKLDNSNYLITDSLDNIWFATEGLRALYAYSKISTATLRHICTELDNVGEITIKDIRDDTGIRTLTLTILKK